MAKPIFLVRLPDGTPNEGAHLVSQHLERKLPDYHIMVIIDRSVDACQFQAFYDKDLIETDFETFKNQVKEMMK